MNRDRKQKTEEPLDLAIIVVWALLIVALIGGAVDSLVSVDRLSAFKNPDTRTTP